jgi:pheromone shutdown protein TraB
MKRNVLIFGSILGAILLVNLVYMCNMCYNNPEFESNDTLGYVALIVVFSLVFFGTRNYRNKELGGAITFGKAFKTGALIALLGATIYVAFWLPYYYLVVPDYMDKYTLHVMAEARRNDATAAALADKVKEMDTFKEMYKNPLFVVLITYAEVLPIGLVVALVSALVLKKKPGVAIPAQG